METTLYNEREREIERKRDRGREREREREGKKTLFIGNSTSWITSIQGAKYRFIRIRHVSYITYKYNTYQPCPRTQYT